MLPDRIFSSFRTASQGASVQRKKMAAATRNIAHSGISAPEGSENGYRPQTIQSAAGDRHDFQRMLLDNISTLRQTRQAHFPVSGQGFSGGSGTGRTGLGPQAETVETDSFRHEFEPNHPDADENGMVRYPDIDLIREMTKMVSANRLYEANLSAIEAEKQIIKRSLEI